MYNFASTHVSINKVELGVITIIVMAIARVLKSMSLHVATK